MKGTMKGLAMLVFGVVILCTAGLSTVNAGSAADLRSDFYAHDCPQVHSIVETVLFDYLFVRLGHSKSLAPALLRMHFHDCFVRGCDASVLIKLANKTAEMDGAPNANSLRGFEVIAAMKAELEKKCPETVSCADTLALAAMFSVKLLKGPSWTVKLGRRDGIVSMKSEAETFIPSPFSDFATLVAFFLAQGLSAKQMTILSAAHTIGSGNCAIVAFRLYGATPDPALSPQFVAYLKEFCPQNATGLRLTMKPCIPLNSVKNNATYKDDGTHVTGCNATFDKFYYDNLLLKQGYFKSDSTLTSNPIGEDVVDTEQQSNSFTKQPFFDDFADSMKAMSEIHPLTKTEGLIKTDCSKVFG